MRIVVVGGTGRIGARVVDRLRAHDVSAAAPSTGVDTLTGTGLGQAFAGAQVVVDVVRPHTYDPEAVRSFFTTSARNTTDAAADAGVAHYVLLTIVGTGHAPQIPFYAAKAAQEQVVRDSGLSYTLVHATQFFEFFTDIADSATHGRKVRLPPAVVQPIAAADVANALAETAVAAPINGDVEIAGPEQFALDEFVRFGLAAVGDRRRVIEDPDALYFGGRLSARTLVPGADARLFPTRFEDWLARRG